jgi:hypothetical protein
MLKILSPNSGGRKVGSVFESSPYSPLLAIRKSTRAKAVLGSLVMPNFIVRVGCLATHATLLSMRPTKGLGQESTRGEVSARASALPRQPLRRTAPHTAAAPPRDRAAERVSIGGLVRYRSGLLPSLPVRSAQRKVMERTDRKPCRVLFFHAGLRAWASACEVVSRSALTVPCCSENGLATTWPQAWVGGAMGSGPSWSASSGGQRPHARSQAARPT